MTGKYQKIRALNEREVKSCHIRDRDEKQALIDRQLTERQNIQDQVRPIHRKHQKLIVQLKKDVAMYLAMSEPDQKTLQDELTQMDEEERGQAKRGRNQGYDQEM
ncbi:MAG: hypothetical protein NPIRA04_00040 [Nitrospirales bacterium]|nr:MAG: hypothetical protein NPIRA04_00040 [Nitrospirales bacterium]